MDYKIISRAIMFISVLITAGTMPVNATAADTPAWRIVWVYDNMYFDYSEEDFDRLAKDFADNGVTHVMAMNSTHYLWNFYREFDRLEKTVAQLDKAFRKHGICFVEHHSSTIMYYSLNDQVRAQSAYWLNYEKDMDLKSDFFGVPLGSIFQHSGITGEPMFMNVYHNYGICPNNPDFRRVYFGFLRRLCAQKVGGLLPDDFFFMAPEACACQHCRKLFNEQTGMSLPTPGQWEKKMADKKSRLYLEWERFRYNSLLDIRTELSKLCSEEHVIQPRFSGAGISWRNPFPVAFDNVPGGDWIFQEAFGGAIRYSWLEYAVEAKHRNMVARWNNAPAMSLFVCENELNLMDFCWMLSLYSGHLLLSDAPGNSLFPDADTRKFERSHASAVFDNHPAAKIAVYDSELSRFLDLDYLPLGASLGQTFIQENIPFEYVGAKDLEKGWINDYELLVVPQIRFMSDVEIAGISDFAERGGQVLWLGESGVRDFNQFSIRTKGELKSMLAENVQRHPVDDFYVRVIPRAMVGGAPFLEPDKWQPPTEEEIQQRKSLAVKIKALLPDCGIETDAPDGVLVSSLFGKKSGVWVVHLLNTCNTMELPDGAEGYRMKDHIPFNPVDRDFHITLLKPDNRTITKASAYSLQQPAMELPVSVSDKFVTVKIPAGILTSHLIIELL